MSDDKSLEREWYAVQDELKAVKAREAELRKQVMNKRFGNLVNQTGTHKQDLSDDVELVLTIPKKVDINKEVFDRVKDSMAQRGLIGDDALIVMKPSVSLTALKYLNAEDQSMFADVFTIKTGSPQMKVVMKK